MYTTKNMFRNLVVVELQSAKSGNKQVTQGYNIIMDGRARASKMDVGGLER